MKKHKKLTRFIFVASIVIVLIGGGVLYYFKDLIFNKPQDSELGEYYGLFGYAPIVGDGTLYIDYSNKFVEYAAEIEAGMAEGATSEQKALAAYIIYRIGCLADATQLMSAKYTIGSGVATGTVNMGETEIDVSGAMNLTASYYNLKYPFTIPSTVEDIYTTAYQKYCVSEEYTQIPKDGVSGSNEDIVKLGEPTLRSTLPFARKTILTPTKKVIWSADQSTCVITPDKATAEFPVRSKYFSIKSQEDIMAEELADDITRPYDSSWGDVYGLTSHDMSIHIINPHTIIGDSVIITKVLGKDILENDKYYYTAEFDIDTVNGSGTTESATYYAENIFKSQAPEIFINFLNGYYLTYSALSIKMSVYENGYFRTFSTNDTWAMGGEVKAVGATAAITSVNSSTEAYCYDYDTIMQGFLNRYYGDMEEVNLPMNELPFISNLSEFTAEPYGSYR